MRIQKTLQTYPRGGVVKAWDPPKIQGCSPGRAGDALWRDARMVPQGELEMLPRESGMLSQVKLKVLPWGMQGCSPVRAGDAPQGTWGCSAGDPRDAP